MKVQVIHRTEQRDGSIKSTLVATVETGKSDVDFALEVAWERTNNIHGSWSKEHIGIPNRDWSEDTTVEAPLHEVVQDDGSIETFGLRSSMIGDIMCALVDGKVSMFRVGTFGFDQIDDEDLIAEIAPLLKLTEGEVVTRQVKFGIRFTVNQYAYSELSHFIQCADNIDDSVRDRYISFLKTVLRDGIKPSTLVDVDVLEIFGSDLDNRAHMDYLEGHYEDDPYIVAGGKMFWGRYKKLKQVHPGLKFSNLAQWA
jgi:hypothetical protein|tara:strand:+ start:1154 stop:1918 length:765 start_codon:yes stop_codon:yes gene_type:complete